MYVQYKEIRNSFLMILYFVDVITKCSMQHAAFLNMHLYTLR